MEKDWHKTDLEVDRAQPEEGVYMSMCDLSKRVLT